MTLLLPKSDTYLHLWFANISQFSELQIEQSKLKLEIEVTTCFCNLTVTGNSVTDVWNDNFNYKVK